MIRTAWTVLVKETRELFRDRRTMLVMLVVPVLLYPAVFVAIEQVALIGVGNDPSTAIVAVPPNLEEGVVQALQASGRLETRTARNPTELVPDRADVALLSTPADGGSQHLTIVFDPASRSSITARAEVRDALRVWGDSLLAARLDARGLARDWAQPLVLADSTTAVDTSSPVRQAGRFLPLLLVIITLLGTFYPALDLGAGEKERGTLESLLTVPVPRSHLIAGKFATVALVGLIAASANLTSMLLTLGAGLFSVPGGLGVDLSLGDITLMFATLLPLAVLFAGLFLGISMRAQSLKEAQSALTPTYMLILIPAMLPAMPGIHLTLATAVVPVGGMVLLFAELLSGNAPLAAGLVAVLATAAYAAAGLAFAASGLAHEETLFGRDDAPQGAQGPLLRRLFGKRGTLARPPLRYALGLVIGIAVLYFYGARLLLALMGVRDPLTATVLAEWLLMFVPTALFLRRTTASPFRALGLDHVPSPRALTAALALAAGGMPIAWLLGWIQIHFLPLPTHLAEMLRQVLHAQNPAHVLWLFVAAALTPAICEEVVFRGALLEGSRGEIPALAAIALNAAIFGGFHISTETVIRFLPTAWMGLLLAVVVWRTRSLWLSMLMHLLYNGTLVYLAVTPKALSGAGASLGPPPAMLIVGGVLLLAAGYAFLPNPATPRGGAATLVSRPAIRREGA